MEGHVRFEKRIGPLVLGAALAALPLGCGEAPASDETVARTTAYLSPGGFCPDTPADGACGCTDNNLVGVCATFTHDTRFYMNLSLYPMFSSLRYQNDGMSSLWVGPNARVKICQDPGGQGNCKIINGTSPSGTLVSSLSDLGAGLDNTVSSLRVDELRDGNCQSLNSGQAAVFEDPNYNNFSPTRDCVVLDRGSYPQYNLDATPLGQHSGGGFGLLTDVISSVMVSGLSGTSLSLWADPNFGGQHVFLRSNVADLTSVAFDGKADSIEVGNCVHDPCATSGGALPGSCDTCAAQICAHDSWCCTSGWDGICAGYVGSVCHRSCS